MASHALLLEVILGGRTRLREVLSAAGEPVGEEAVNREWIGFFKNPIRAEVRANHHMQHLANMLPRVAQSLLDRSWLLTVFERKTLATCDHPVHVVPNEDLTQTGRGTGIENAPVIYVPLTHRHSLAMYLPSEVAVNAQLGAGLTKTTAKCSSTPGSVLTTSTLSWSSSRITAPLPAEAMASAPRWTSSPPGSLRTVLTNWRGR